LIILKFREIERGTMTEEQVIEAVKDRHFGSVDLDAVCIKRLRDRSEDFVSSGRTVRELLDIIERLLEI